MNTYLVSYFIDEEKDALGLPALQYFVCDASNVSHSVEQMKDAYPDGQVVQVHLCIPELLEDTYGP